MAEIRDTLILEIDNALRDVGRIETALDRALASVEVRLDSVSANRQLADLADSANRALDDIDVGFDPTTANRQLADLGRTADRALSDIDLDIDTSQVRELESTLQEVERIAARSATETQSIAVAAGRAEVNFEDLARAMGITEDRARDVTTELLQSQAASNRLEDSARDVARQLGLSDREAERLAGSLREADRAAESIDVATLGLGTRFAALRTSAGGIASALAGIGAGAVLGGAIVGANAAIQSFARLEDSINAVNVVFGVASSSVLQFGEDAAASAGLSQEAFNQAVVPIGALLQNFGFDAREAADAAVILVQRGADLASVYGGSVNDALLAVGAALRGEADPLERYGASVSAARVETFALAEGLARTKAELTPAILLQARYGLILADTAVVSGDFVNTADDLANAQRSAGAAVQDFVADIGEKLAPALETILVLLPEVLEGLRQLVPGFAAAAGSAAAFFESVGEGGGFRTEFAAIKAGFDVVTGGAGLAVEAGQVFSAGLRGDFAEVAAAATRGGTLIERAFGRGIAVTLANSLDAGTDALTAFKTAIAQTASGSSNLAIFTGNYRDFAIAADLSATELREVTQDLLANAGTLRLTGEEVIFLNEQLTQLNGLLAVDTRRRGPFLDLGDIATPLATVTTRFTTFTDSLGDSLGEVPGIIDGITVRAATAAEGLLRAVNPFDQDPEIFTQSIKTFFAEVTEDINREAIFQQGIIELTIAERFDLARMLADLGSGAQPQLSGFLANLDLAKQVDDALRTGETEVSTNIGQWLEGEIAKIPPGPIQDELVQLLVDDVITSPAVESATVAGVRRSVAPIGDGYQRAISDLANQIIPDGASEIGRSIETHWRLEEEANTAAVATGESFLDGIAATIIPESVKSALNLFGIEIDLFGAGAYSRATYMDGLSTPVQAEVQTLRESIASTVNSAIYADSPPKLFVDFGEASGSAFWAGFEVVEPPSVSLPEVDLPPVVPVIEFVVPNLDLIGFADIGSEVGTAFMAGISAGTAGETARLREAVLSTLNAAISEGSPPKLFLDAGTEAGDTYWSGFGEVEAPTAVIPPIEIPEVVIPPIDVPDVVIPPILVPEVVIPDIELPRVVLPEVLLPKIEIPPIEIPDVEIPDIVIAEVVLSEVLLPEIAVPDVVLPRVSVPDIDLPEFDLTSIGIEAGASLISGFTSSAGNGGMALRVAILRSLDRALDRQSPLEAGRDSGGAFWSGFGDVVAPTVVFPPIDVPEIPSIEVPDVEIPDVLLPDIVIPDVFVLPEVVLPDVVLPEITVPDVILPDIAIPDVVLPEIIIPDVFVIPEVVVPDMVLPEITVPNIVLPSFNLTDIGAEAGYSLISGITAATGSGAAELRSSILDVLDRALDRHSPSQLFLDAGLDAGDAFWAGFNQASLTLRNPIAPVAGAVTTAGSSAVAGGVNVELNLYNTTMSDAVSDVARLAQIAGSVAHTYNAVRN